MSLSSPMRSISSEAISRRRSYSLICGATSAGGWGAGGGVAGAAGAAGGSGGGAVFLRQPAENASAATRARATSGCFIAIPCCSGAKRPRLLRLLRLFFAADGLLEVLDPLTEAAAQLGDAAGAE